MTDIIEAIESLFIIRKDCYPMQMDNKNDYRVIKKPLTRDLIEQHLKGDITIGCYQANPITKNVKWVCFDFDGVIEDEFEKAKRLFFRLKNNEMNPLMEFSGRRGYHIWLFIEPTKIDIARAFVLEWSKDNGVADVYPRNDKIGHNGYGSQVKMPLGMHRVSWKRSYLLDENLNVLSQGNSEKLIIEIADKKRDLISIIDERNLLKDFIKKKIKGKLKK